MVSLNDFINKKEDKVSESNLVEKNNENLEDNQNVTKQQEISFTNITQKSNFTLEKKNTDLIPWTKKYIPTLVSNIVGNEKAIKKVQKFITHFSKEKKKALFLWGPSGVGKSTVPFALSEELGYEFIELNASDTRNKAVIEEKLGNILNQQSLFGNKKIILIDDVDGLSGFKDRGGATSIAKLIEKSKFPIILTAQDPYDKKLSPLRSKSTLIEFESISSEEITSFLIKILEKEGISYSKKDIEVISSYARGDIRAGITDLQMLTIGTKSLDLKLLENLSNRLQNTDIKTAIKNILKGNGKELLQAFDDTQEDYDKILLWLDYNAPIEYSKDIDRARLYGCLTKADVFFRRIRRRQHWRFLVYIQALLTIGVASSKDSVYEKELDYKENTRILKIWQANMKYAKRKAIAEKVALATHNSTSYVIKNFGFYKNYLSIHAEELDLTAEEVAYISQNV